MKRSTLILLTVLIALLAVLGLAGLAGASRNAAPAAPLAGAPTIISYQGQVIVSGVAFSGTGYFKLAVVDQPGTTSYWSNDGTSSDGSEPSYYVKLSVSAGLFNVLLGDTTLSGMTQALTASVFSGTSRYLRVWFSSDNVTFTQLVPDRRIAAVPYALQATSADFLDGQDASAFWSLTGNSGTNPTTNYLGTSDAVSLTLAVSGTAAVRIDTSRNVGLGTSSPTERLTVAGNGLILGEDNPAAAGYTSTNLDTPRAVFVAGRYAYVASYDNDRLAIFDVADPANIVAIGSITTNLDGPRSVYVVGRYAYVASATNDRLVVFDVSDPAHPVAKGSTNANLDGPYSVYVAGRYAYVASYTNNRLAVFDVADPNNLAAQGYTSTNLYGPRSVYVAGRYAYVVSDGNDTLAVFDVADPNSLVAKGSISTNLDGLYSVYVAGRYAYVASYNNDRLAVFDVADPDSLVAKGYISTNLDGPLSVYVAGRYAYVASANNDRLVVFDVADSNNLVAKGYTSTNLDGPYSVYVAGRYAYVAANSNDRLAIFDLNHLESPTLETGSLWSGTLQVSDNAIVGNDLEIQGALNVGPGGALIDGSAAIAGSLRVASGHIQFPTITGSAPPAADCNEASEAGRVVVRTDGAVNLYICTGATGWVGK
jgi:hypothetical protein